MPLQLMDFAYRYTSSVLSDAVHVQAEGYDQASTSTDTHGRGRGAGRGAGGAAARGVAAAAEEGDVSLSALRMARLEYILPFERAASAMMASTASRQECTIWVRSGPEAPPRIISIAVPCIRDHTASIRRVCWRGLPPRRCVRRRRIRLKEGQGS